jgi:hypothetical protein
LHIYIVQKRFYVFKKNFRPAFSPFFYRCSMPRFLFVAHDPGGANVIQPVIESYLADAEAECHFLLLGPAATRIQLDAAKSRLHIVRSFATPNFPNELSAEPDDVRAILEACAPDAVISATSFNSNLERLAVRFANERGVPTFSILDFWSNYAKRFTLGDDFCPPRTLFVADERMKQEAEAELPPAQTQVVVAGNPHLQRVASRYALRRRSVQPAMRIRFFCENIRHYYPEKPVNEFSVVPQFLAALAESGFEGEFIVRPHPMESRAPWEEALADYAARGIAPRVRLALDAASFDEILGADGGAAVGFSSMALLETASVGIPTFSYQIAVPNEYFWLPFAEYGIDRITSSESVRRVVETLREVSRASTATSAPKAFGDNGSAVKTIRSHIALVLSASKTSLSLGGAGKNP